MTAPAALDGDAIWRALEAIRFLRETCDRNPLSAVRWTPPQRAWLSCRAPVKLLRAGNQIGKTHAAMAEVIWRATGTHPYYPTRPPPVEIWVVCTSWSQSVAIMGKFWALVPRDALREGTRFDPKNGFGKDNPAVVFRCGSVVRFRTTNQGPEALAGATVDYVAIDEPTDLDIFRELEKRVMRRAGQVGITLTPINRPCDWLKEMVDKGSVTEVHARLTVENLTPEGGLAPFRLLDGTPMDAEWIALQWRKTPAMYAPVVLDGEWETRPEGVFFSCFDRAKHIAPRAMLDPAVGRIRWHMGIDYASADRPNGLVAVLVQVQAHATDTGRTTELILVRDMVTLPGTATMEMFAADVLKMLQRQGIRWSDLTSVYGDNPVNSRFEYKSNIDFTKKMARELGIPREAMKPPVRNAKDDAAAAGMLAAGARYIYESLASARMVLHPGAEPLAQALETWDYDRMHPAKDRIDALRYALKDCILARRPVSSAGLTVRVS